MISLIVLLSLAIQCACVFRSLVLIIKSDDNDCTKLARNLSSF